MRYPVTLHERLYTIVLVPIVVVVLMAFAFAFYPVLAPMGSALPLETVLLAAVYTCARLVIAYAIAVLVAIPLALLVMSNKIVEAICLPIFDIIESVPVLALFPVVVMLFVRFGNLNGAAIFIIFLAMLWNIVFTLVGGLKLVPQDIIDAGRIFGVRGFELVRQVLLPAAFPQFVTGSILATAQGWNIIIVAEVLHTYIPGGTASQDLFGIGSVLVNAAANAQNGVFLTSVLVMVIIIALLNFFVWQKLLHYAQRFRFE